MKRLPIAISSSYVAVYITVLINSLFWPVGDQTDLIRPGVVAAPVGLFLSFFYPGSRNGAFVVVSLAAAINALLIFCASRWLIRRTSRRV